MIDKPKPKRKVKTKMTILNKQYVEQRIDDIIERIDALEMYNGNDNGRLARIEVIKFKKEILEFLKLQDVK